MNFNIFLILFGMSLSWYTGLWLGQITPSEKDIRIYAERECYYEHLKNIYTANGQDLNKIIDRKVWRSKKDEENFNKNKEIRIQQFISIIEKS